MRSSLQRLLLHIWGKRDTLTLPWWCTGKSHAGWLHHVSVPKRQPFFPTVLSQPVCDVWPSRQQQTSLVHLNMCDYGACYPPASSLACLKSVLIYWRSWRREEIGDSVAGIQCTTTDVKSSPASKTICSCTPGAPGDLKRHTPEGLDAWQRTVVTLH